MLSLQHCRKALGANVGISDETLVRLRDQLYRFVELALDIRNDRHNAVKPFDHAFDKVASSLEDPDILRAAIIEFEGNVSRDEAERTAIAESIANEQVN